MEFWYTDQHTKDVRFSMKVVKQISVCESEFQRVDILETVEFGRVLIYDGELMITEKDEFIYHEMITHVPLAVHPHVFDVLVIGGGDGGTVRELCKYPSIKRIDLVEIDKEVVEMCKKHFQRTACSFDDKRVHIYFDEGLHFVRSPRQEYDLIIVDCADPYGPAEGFFTREFYG